MRVAVTSGLRPRVGLRVLLVESDAHTRAQRAKGLSADGFEVFEASTLAEAAKHLVAAPAIIVIDRDLPDGDGFAVARALRERGGDLVIIAVIADEAITTATVDAACDAFIARSDSPTLLVETIRTVLLRRTGEPSPDSFATRPTSMPPSGKPRVLVVDDSDDNRLLYASTIAEAGYEVEETTNGLEALEAVARRRPDVIVMDLSMPVLDGWQATRQLKSNPTTASIVVIAITAHTTIFGLRQSTEAGADAVLTKPCLPQDLLGVIAALLPHSMPRQGVAAGG